MHANRNAFESTVLIDRLEAIQEKITRRIESESRKDLNRNVGSDQGEPNEKRQSVLATLDLSIRDSSIWGLSNDFFDDSSWTFICNDLLLSAMNVQRLFMLQSELIQHGRLEVVWGHDVLDRSVPKLIGLTKSHSGLA